MRSGLVVLKVAWASPFIDLRMLLLLACSAQIVVGDNPACWAGSEQFGYSFKVQGLGGGRRHSLQSGLFRRISV